MFVDGRAGRIETRLDLPDVPPRAAVVLAGPHPDTGGSMLSRVMHFAARGFCRIGCVTLRFNYRGSGLSEGTFDDGRGEIDDMASVLQYLAVAHPGLPLWTGGYAFGAWVATTVGARDPRVRLLAAIAPAVDLHDYSIVADAGKPVFLVQGDRDLVSPLASTRRFYATLDEPRELAIVDGGDHEFDGLAEEVADAIDDLLGDYDPDLASGAYVDA